MKQEDHEVSDTLLTVTRKGRRRKVEASLSEYVSHQTQALDSMLLLVIHKDIAVVFRVHSLRVRILHYIYTSCRGSFSPSL